MTKFVSWQLSPNYRKVVLSLASFISVPQNQKLSNYDYCKTSALNHWKYVSQSFHFLTNFQNDCKWRPNEFAFQSHQCVLSILLSSWIRQTPSCHMIHKQMISSTHMCVHEPRKHKAKSRSTTILKAKHSDTIKILSIFNSEVEKNRIFSSRLSSHHNQVDFVVGFKTLLRFFPLKPLSLPHLTLMKISYLEFYDLHLTS